MVGKLEVKNAADSVLEEESAYREKSGGIAQLGERLHGMQEVSGSIPLTSTNTPAAHRRTSEKKN